MDNPLWQALSVVADMMLLNLLTLLCCMPVITMGAAFTAMNDVVIRIIRQENSGILKSYGRAFRQNLKKGTLFGLILLLAAGLLYIDYLCALAYAPAFRYGIAAMCVLVLAVAIYTFALLARYENSVVKTIKNAAMLAVAYFPQTLAMVAFTVAFWLLGSRYYRIGAPILFLFGFSLPCYVSVILMRRMFEQLESKSGNGYGDENKIENGNGGGQIEQ